MFQCWEENPDIYGIRRSGRERKEPERIKVELKGAAKKHRKRSKCVSVKFYRLIYSEIFINSIILNVITTKSML